MLPQFTRTFPEASDHWALQAPSDAVPHLPFRAWGFRHPTGVAKLGEGHVVCEDGGPAIRRSDDRGDTVDWLRPANGDVRSWAFCHDLRKYVEYLKALVDVDATVEGGVGGAVAVVTP